MLEFIKTLKPVDTQALLDCYYKLENQIEWVDYGQGSRQAGLQYKNNDDPWSSAVGKSRGSDFDFDKLNPAIVGTVFESIIEEYSLTRTRFMWVGPHKCYSFHKDTSPRIHLPLITNDECYFLFHNSLRHLPTGASYWVDTTQRHTFLNTSLDFRLHLVGAVRA
jgi:hypothetical protein